jgi:prolactin regulatory element-binding protein
LQRLYEVNETGEKLDLLTELELEKDEDAPMSMAIDYEVRLCSDIRVNLALKYSLSKQNTFICGINGTMEKVEAGINPHCRVFSIEMKEDMKPL